MINFFEIIDFKTSKQKEVYCSLISLNNQIVNIRKRELAKLPYHINLLSLTSSNVKETHHSIILHKLLKKQEILDSFISNLLHIHDIDFKIKEIRDPDKDRMDLSIYGRKKCIIIENKVNDAPEMSGQIFRYVRKANIDNYNYEDIIVVYLNSNHRVPPTFKSTSENGDGIKFIPEIVGKNMIVLDYSHDIYNWLKKELDNINLQKESFLWSSLYLYCDYIEEKFYKSKKYDKMKEEIRKKIDLEVLEGLNNENDPDFNTRIEKLDQMEEELSELMNDIREYRQIMSDQQDKMLIEDALSKRGLKLIPLKDELYGEDNYGVEFRKNGKKAYIALGFGNEPYIGIAGTTSLFSETDKKQLADFFSTTGMEALEEEPAWIAWNAIRNHSTLPKEFISLVDTMIEKSKKASYKLEIKEDSNQYLE